jgi:hypothetical protein
MHPARVLAACSVIAIPMSVPMWPASANPIVIFDTGVDNNGAVLPAGSVDPHYTLVSTPNGPGSAYVVDQGSPIQPNGPWIHDGKKSAWIAPAADQGNYGVTGQFDYRMTFSLKGLDRRTAVLKGKWSTDNEATIYLNGVATANTTSPDSYTTHTRFSLKRGFIRGINTLDFIVNNDPNGEPDNPTGLRVKFTQATANPK